MQTATQEAPQLFTLSQFAQAEPAFKETSLRWLVFNAERNGLAQSGAIVRLGRRVLLDRTKFFGWLLSQQTHQRAA